MRKITVIVDADAIVAQANLSDANFARASKIAKKLTESGAAVLYPVTAVAEASGVIQRVFKSPATAYGTAVSFVNRSPEVLVDVTAEILKRAVGWFNPKASKKNTLFDCIVAAVAVEYQADAIFSFNHFYKSRGFVLVEDLLAGKR